MTSIEWGVRTDLGGKRVDRIAAPRRLWLWTYEPTPENEHAAVQALVVELLCQLSKHPNRRVRDRDLVVWWGQTTSLNETIRAVGLPEHLDYRVHQVLDPLVELPGRISHGAYAFADANAAPVASYNRGRVVAYTDPFAPPGSLDGTELRSADVAISPPPALRRDKLPRLSAPNGPLYSLELWQNAREPVLDAIYSLIGPSSYASLRVLVTEDLRITVRARPAGSLRALGRLSAGWLEPLEDGAPAARAYVDLQRGLPPALRYVVLAHELAHFVLHFPLLLVAQLVEQIAWELPVTEEVWEARLALMLPSHEELERNADQLAVNLLIPPRWFPLERVTQHMMQTGFGSPDPRHLIWHFLQAVFPDTAGMEYSWHNWEEHERRAAEQTEGEHDVPLDAQTLFGRMLVAALANEDGSATELQERVGTAVAETCQGMLETLDELVASDEDGRDARADELLEELASPRTAPTLPDELRSLAGDRELVPAADGRPRARRLPLIPARGAGRRWVCPLRDEPSTDLAGWQERCPERALVLYSQPPPLP